MMMDLALSPVDLDSGFQNLALQISVETTIIKMVKGEFLRVYGVRSSKYGERSRKAISYEIRLNILSYFRE